MTEYRKRVPPASGVFTSEDGRWLCEGEPRDAYDEVFSADDDGRVLVDVADLDRFNLAHEVPRRSRLAYTADPSEPIDHGMARAAGEEGIMTNAEAIEETARLHSALHARIASGIIPPRPNPLTHHADYQRWYDEHVRCSTQDHRYMQREHPSPYCKLCLAQPKAEEPKRVRRPRLA